MLINGVNIVELLGHETAILLAEKLGGIRVYVGKANDNGRLERCIGSDATRKMFDLFGGDVVHVPLCNDLLALHYHRQGFSLDAIALKLRMTDRGVAKMLKRLNS